MFFNPPPERKLVTNVTSLSVMNASSPEPIGAGVAKAESQPIPAQAPVKKPTVPQAPKNEVVKSVVKNEDVIQRIPPKVDNQTMDYIVQVTFISS